VHFSAVPTVLSIVNLEKLSIFVYHESIPELMPDYFADHAYFHH
jgi:hypothetical protein